MNSGIHSIDKSQFLSFAQKISKSNLINKSLIKNCNNNRAQPKNNSNLIYSNILPNKERSRSVNLMMSTLLKQKTETPKENEKENNELKDLLSDNDENNIKTCNLNDISFSSNISNDSTLNQKNKNYFNRTKSQSSRTSFCDSYSVKSDYGVSPSKNIISFLNKHLANNNNNNILSNLNYKSIPSTPTYNSNTATSASSTYNNNNLNINLNKYNNNIPYNLDEVDNYSSRSINSHKSNINSATYFNVMSVRENNVFRKNNNNGNIRCFNPINSHLNNNNNNNNKKYTPNLKFAEKCFTPQYNNYDTPQNINNNNIQYKIETYNCNKRSLTEIENNDNVAYNNNIITDNSNNIYYSRSPIINQNSNNNNINNNNKENIVFQLEDLIVLEEKLFSILYNFSNEKPLPKLCIEWWNFYTYTSFGGNFEMFFNNEINSINYQIGHESSILELLSIILVYEALRDQSINQNTLNLLKNLLNNVHQNFLIVCDFILQIINSQILQNIWINKLQNVISSKLNHRINSNSHISLLKKGNHTISSIIKTILKQYQNGTKINTSALNYYFKKISNISPNTLNEYFKKKINQDYCKTGDNLSFIINENISNQLITIPYLNTRISKGKKFTLVLDLDETLISYRLDELGRGVLKPRPNLYNFLSEMCKIFEIIIFTAGTQEYADPILDIIEKKKLFFDKRLYRQHTIIMDNVFVKDLSKLGRDLSKVIIVDNMPQNFKLQKENGIFIKNFNGDDKNDSALIDLIPILRKITCDINNDVRVELSKLKNEIFTKITTNLENDDK